jgi:hypothetical protein
MNNGGDTYYGEDCFFADALVTDDFLMRIDALAAAIDR